MSPTDIEPNGPTGVFGYLDTNGVEDFSGPRPPVDLGMRSALLAAIADGRLILPFSEAVSQEIAAIALKDREKANRLGRFYLKIASFDHALPASGIALRNAIAERLGDPVPSSYTSLTRRQRRDVGVRLSGKGPSDVTTIAANYRKDAQQWADDTRGYRDKAREGILAKQPGLKPMPLPEAVAGIWSQMAPWWAWGLVDGRGLLARAKEAKLADEDLLAIGCVRVAVGSAIGLAAAQTINARLPHPADYGDFQHCTLATYAGIPLVTSDKNLRKIVEAIPDSPLRVISPADLLVGIVDVIALH